MDAAIDHRYAGGGIYLLRYSALDFEEAARAI
jgi:hypothetical protein